jgi:hypothetical protein
MILIKRGWHPQPIHGQPDGVLPGASSQKRVFFAGFYSILIKSVPPGLADGGENEDFR